MGMTGMTIEKRHQEFLLVTLLTVSRSRRRVPVQSLLVARLVIREGWWEFFMQYEIADIS
jgi:hypothetical protein